MASKSKQVSKRKGAGSSVTAPKGRPTAGRGETTERGPRITPMMEWIIALVVITAILVGVFLIWGDARSPLGGGHSGLAPADTVEVLDVGVG